MSSGGRSLVAVTATRTETRAARAVLAGRGVTVVRAGVHRVLPAGRLPPGAALVSVGLCGALDGRLRPGDAVIPDEVGDGSGRIACDARLVAALRAAAEALCVRVDPGPLLTSSRLVTGELRREAARDGWSAVDMESALLAGGGRPFAAVRVVLDTPLDELDPAWANPVAALLRPRLWGEARRLAVAAPRHARLAARIVAAAAGPLRAVPLGLGAQPTPPRN